MSAPKIDLFTFSPAHGLPTSGPFGLKLEVCLRQLGVDYTRHYEDDVRKGPKRKSPWIVDGGERMGDTELILAHLERRYGLRLDTDLSPAEAAQGLVLRRMLEEHFHQIFEYELVVLDAGWRWLEAVVAKSVPFPLSKVVPHAVRSSFRKHLFERGVARHRPEEVLAMGKADLDALAELLGDREWFVADHPSKTDASAFGLLGCCILSDIETPMMQYARTLDPLVRFVHRARDHFFPELSQGGQERDAA